MRVKLEDVAKEAGVSIATVSRVLNNHSVSAKGKKAVEKAIIKLDYSPNLLARGLIKGKSFRIGVVLTAMENPYYSTIMNSIEVRLRNEGYLCNFASCTFQEDEQKIVRQFLDSGIDGLIYVEAGLKGDNNTLFANINKQIPVVLINGNPDRTDTNLIIMDQDMGMESVMDYFHSLGHKKIGFVRGVDNSLPFQSKEKVYRAKMEEFGFPVKENYIYKMPDFDHFKAVEETSRIFREKLTKQDRPSAIFSSNEIMAHGLLKATRELGISIPDELSVIAQDNTILSRISHPALTTVDMEISRLGIESAEMMLQLLATEKPMPRRLIFYPRLIKRESCGPCSGY